MNCMKCGRETKEDAVFCDDCLEHMEKYPVPENTLAYVPTDKDRATAAKKQTMPLVVSSSEDQTKRLKREADILRLMVILFALLSMFLGIISMETLKELELSSFVGQNYKTVVTTEAVD